MSEGTIESIVSDIRLMLNQRLQQLDSDREQVRTILQGLPAVNGVIATPPGYTASGARQKSHLTAERRAEISQRMKAYWAKRRKTERKARRTA